MSDEIKNDNWKKIKEQFYPSEPVIELGEMDFETMYPWGLPKEERGSIDIGVTKTKRDNLANQI